MPWTIRYHETRPDKPRVGDMWPAPWLVKCACARPDCPEPGPSPHFLSDRYIMGRLFETRMPLVVRLPGLVDFCVDGPFWEDGKRGGDGWAVAGEVPHITLHPSINIRGVYHGWIKDGIISDDVEGRRFERRQLEYEGQ